MAVTEHVPQFVRDDALQLVVIHHVDQRRAHHDERSIQAERGGIHAKILRDIKLGALRIAELVRILGYDSLDALCDRAPRELLVERERRRVAELLAGLTRW